MGKLISNPIIVSELFIDEAEILRQVLSESYQQYERYYSPQGWKDYSRKIVSSVDSPNVDKILVAKRNQEIIGSLQLFKSSEKAYGNPELEIQAPIIRLLAVLPRARGYGVGKALLATAINEVKTSGQSNMYLHTTEFMDGAIQLYKGFGFRRDESKDFVREDILCKCYRLDV
ncbi:GNAT family N-acetyltransferase [Oceanobacillus alkalisoli]|uniref:GNAT family N-acetyltransferase n=1 Tax=Oceanobacillus alkalisoli TaxID=2925113 RepID=UPI001F11CBC8|nr:GNAT family N-acetyltransferase [Oceanobacillus alkalisoli]MCF3943713.1 GNAT family N-acetyltransferase [Oceanobacillus alkalisoli]